MFSKLWRPLISLSILFSVPPKSYGENLTLPVIIGLSSSRYGSIEFKDGNSQPILYGADRFPFKWLGRNFKVSSDAAKVLLDIVKQFHSSLRSRNLYKIPLNDIYGGVGQEANWLQIGRFTNKARAVLSNGSYVLEIEFNVKNLEANIQDGFVKIYSQDQLRWINIEAIQTFGRQEPRGVDFIPPAFLNEPTRAAFHFTGSKKFPALVVAQDVFGFSYFMPDGLVHFTGADREIPIMKIPTTLLSYPKTEEIYSTVMLPITKVEADEQTKLFSSTFKLFKAASLSAPRNRQPNLIVQDAIEFLKNAKPWELQSPCSDLLFNPSR